MEDSGEEEGLGEVLGAGGAFDEGADASAEDEEEDEEEEDGAVCS